MFFDLPIALATVNIHPLVMKGAQLLLAVSFLLALLRLAKGPDVTDRVVALDLIAGIILAFTLLRAIGQRDIDFMNVSLVIAVVAFLGTVAIARYLSFRVASKVSDQEDDRHNHK